MPETTAETPPSDEQSLHIGKPDEFPEVRNSIHANNYVSKFIQEHQATEDLQKLPSLIMTSDFSLEAEEEEGGDTFVDELDIAEAKHEPEDAIKRIRRKTIQEDIPIWKRIMNRKAIIREDGTIEQPKRFRAVARMIKTNLAWTQNMTEKTCEQQDALPSTSPETPTFDVNHFKVKDRSYGGLTFKARKILMKHPMDRNEDDLLVLRDVVERLKCFIKYPQKMKQEIARVICYENYADGRVIIQQGHVGHSLYFIVNGKVEVLITKTDKATGKTASETLGQLTEGSTFGELALLHNIKRTATIVCKGASEFLRVDKEDFEAVLRSSYEREWTERMNALTCLPIFEKWTKSELLDCNNCCILKEYLPNTVIYGNTNETPDFISFVLSGECQLVRRIILTKETMEFGRTVFHIPTEKQMLKYGERLKNPVYRRQTATYLPEEHFWNICTFTKGYFGVGEDMTDTFVVAKSKVSILLVPRIHFKPNRNSELDKMVENLNASLPCNRALFHKYCEEHSWLKYKSDVINDIVQKRNNVSNTTSFEDVPLSVRLVTNLPANSSECCRKSCCAYNQGEEED